MKQSMHSFQYCTVVPEAMNSKIKHFSNNGGSKCENCIALKSKLDDIKEMLEAQQQQSHDICKILSEHKVLLNQVLAKNKALDSVMAIFPINAVDELGELDDLIAAQKDLYVRYIKSLIKGNISRNLHEIFGKDIVMALNTDGTHGKKKLKDYKNLYHAIIDAIVDNQPEEKFRAALQKAKKKYFKQASKKKSEENVPARILPSGIILAEILISNEHDEVSITVD